VPLFTRSTNYFAQPDDNHQQDRTQLMYTSQWAEVAYFLIRETDQNGNNPQSANGMPLYTLQRQIRVIVPDNRGANSQQLATSLANQFTQMSWRPDPSGQFILFNSPYDVAYPPDAAGTLRRSQAFNWTAQGDPAAVGNNPAGSGVNTMLLSDVVSFTVRVIPSVQLPLPQGVNVPFGYPVGVNPPVAGADTFIDIPGGLYDSSSASQQAPGFAGIMAIQITIRVWDLRSQQTRQITIVQDM
jgi:hypothetical protein